MRMEMWIRRRNRDGNLEAFGRTTCRPCSLFWLPRWVFSTFPVSLCWASSTAATLSSSSCCCRFSLASRCSAFTLASANSSAQTSSTCGEFRPFLRFPSIWSEIFSYPTWFQNSKSVCPGCGYCSPYRPGHQRHLQHRRRGLDVLLLPRFVHRSRGSLQMVQMLRADTQLLATD